MNRNLIKHQAAMLALNTMMSKSFFSICAVNEVADLAGLDLTRVRQTEAYRILRPLHCVDFNKIPKATREQIPELIKEALTEASHVFQFPMQTLEAVREDFIDVIYTEVREEAQPEAAPKARFRLRLPWTRS